MFTNIVDYEKASEKIIGVLRNRSYDKKGDDLIRYIYNEAIDDAANFIRDLAPKIPPKANTFYLAEKAIRHWLRLR
ncbi:MAG: hypothetical protein K940chlam7_02008 [Chlamydiae bacterium]|nr:hypothetical protein [Chlamydiota bacterium]